MIAECRELLTEAGGREAEASLTKARPSGRVALATQSPRDGLMAQWAGRGRNYQPTERRRLKAESPASTPSAPPVPSKIKGSD